MIGILVSKRSPLDDGDGDEKLQHCSKNDPARPAHISLEDIHVCCLVPAASHCPTPYRK